MSKTIEEILAPKPEARPRIYAYSIADKARLAPILGLRGSSQCLFLVRREVDGRLLHATHRTIHSWHQQRRVVNITHRQGRDERRLP